MLSLKSKLSIMELLGGKKNKIQILKLSKIIIDTIFSYETAHNCAEFIIKICNNK